MIWVRRFFAVILAVVLLVFLIGAIALQTANRATSPGFIKAELVKVDAYGFLYNDLLETALGDQIEDELKLPEDLGRFKFDNPAQTKRVVLDAIKETFPPEYTQRQVEEALDELVPYLKGQTDEFEIRPRLDERARAAARAIAKAIDELNLSAQLIDSVLGPTIDDSLKELSFGGARLNITAERARAIANRIAPEEWVNAQIAGALTEFVSWLTGDQDSFVIAIRLADRVPAARDEIKTLLRETNVTGFLFDSVIAPQLTRAIGSFSSLSFGIPVTDAEVKVALEQAAPRAWVDQQLAGLIDVMADYLSGASDDLSFSMPLGERRAETIEALSSLAEAKLSQAVGRLPVCASPADIADAASRIASVSMPTCVPPGTDAAAVAGVLKTVLDRDLDRLIGGRFPEQITFDRAALESQLGKDAFAGVDAARKLIGNGYTFTDADLKKNLSADSTSSGLNLDEIRKFFQPDFVVTQADFLDRIALDQSSDPEARAEFENIRSYVGTVVSFLWLAILIPLVLAAAIGFLGGRQWASRLAWGSASLAITGLIVWIGLSVAYGRVQPLLHEQMVNNANELSEPSERRLALAGIEKVEIVAADVAAGAKGIARNWTILGVLGVAAAAGLIYYARSARTGGGGPAAWLREKLGARKGVATAPASPSIADPAGDPGPGTPGKPGGTG